MEKNTEDKEELAENKLKILYLLNKANCTLTNLQIQRLLYDVDDINYYYFQHLLSELVAQRYIANYEKDEEWLYEITIQGKELLELTENILPGIIKHQLDVAVKEKLFDVQNEVSITSKFVPENDNEYTTVCRISESHKTLFELKIYCASNDQAKLISENWNKHANEYYPEIIKMLTEE